MSTALLTQVLKKKGSIVPQWVPQPGVDIHRGVSVSTAGCGADHTPPCAQPARVRATERLFLENQGDMPQGSGPDSPLEFPVLGGRPHQGDFRATGE